MSRLETSMSSAAAQKPITGEISKTLKTLMACSQSTPEVPLRRLSNWLAMPTPMMEPTMVCELEAGSPKYQVLRFQRIAAISSAKTIAKPEPLPTCKINSTGSKVMMVNATAPVESKTPMKFQVPDHATAKWGSREWV